MRLKYIKTATIFLWKDLMRNRLIAVMLVVIPTIFYFVVWFTTSEKTITIRIASVQIKPYLKVVQQDLGLVFIGLVTTGLIAAFITMNLMQRNLMSKKRLILAGYKTYELVISKSLIAFLIVILVAIYISLMGLLLLKPLNFAGMSLGYILCGFVYGSYGMLIGALVKRELEGILFVVLLSNIDVAWLQNPIYYAQAQEKAIIEWLPAFFPSQVSITSAFTEHPVGHAVIGSLLYGFIFLILAMIIFRHRIKTANM